METFAGLLEGPRARGAFLLRSSLDPPWSLLVADEAPLTLVAVVRGPAWVQPQEAPPLELRTGDVAVLRGPQPYTVADPPGTPAQVRIGPDQRCVALTATTTMAELGPRSWGNSPDGATQLLTGTYQLRSEVSRRLLAALPPTILVRADSWDNPLVGFLADEISKDELGQEAVLDRLLDLLLIATLRRWFSRPDVGAPSGYRALTDPLLGPALRRLNDDPGHPWTVAELAGVCGLSRAAFARRFTELVGEPPMRFLTDYRITLAADLLHEPGETLSTVARRVGYASPFALSAAFKRSRGVSPDQYRRAVAG